VTDLSFPRAHARSQRFTLGRPRSFTVAPDGSCVLFLRSSRGDDPVHDLWSMDPTTGTEQRLVEVAALAVDDRDLPAAERARRERAREGGGGIVSYATDRDVTTVGFALAGQAYVTLNGRPTRVATDGPAYDVRPSPDGRRLAAIVDGALHVGNADGLAPLVAEEGVTWGVADFVAAEEMRRMRGFWWDGDDALLVCRVDESAVPTFTIADPAHPDRPAADHRYPAAGTTNPDVTLWRVDVATGQRAPITWDREAFPYLAAVVTDATRPTLLHVQSRDQRTAQVLVVEDGDTRLLRQDTDPAWVELVPGTPAWAGSDLAVVVDLHDHGPDGSRALVVGDRVVTPPGMQVRDLVAVDADHAWLTVSLDDPTQVHVVRLDLGSGNHEVVTGDTPGVHAVTPGGDVRVIVSATLDADPAVTVHGPDGTAHPVPGRSLESGIDVEVEMLVLGERRLRAALLRPTGDGPWPVLLDPYGGPHAQRVVSAKQAHLVPAWFASQGLAVLVVDGRGSPGRGPAWEREVRGDLAGPPLQDQVDALEAAAKVEPRLDLDRVAIRGWSFGGYLAALACLRRPDVFRAGIVGAPVTDWRLYDTHYTERYLGHPDEDPDAYHRSAVVDADGVLVGAADGPDGRRTDLLIIHGLADDNVVAAHSLRLSSALLAAGRPHAFLPLSGVTHMTPQDVVAENLLLLQRDFLLRSLT
jgi:dipeptidyl-peptidase 4